MCFTYFQVCAKSKTLVYELNFVNPGDKSIFLLHKIIYKDNNTNVQSFNDQWVNKKRPKYPHFKPSNFSTERRKGKLTIVIHSKLSLLL